MRMIITGVLFIFGGLSGSFVLRGTGSGGALALVGLVLVAIGVFQASQQASERTQEDEDRLRDDDEWERYEEAKRGLAQRQAQARETTRRRRELDALVAGTPGAREAVDEVLARTKPYLAEDEQLALALETAQRLSAGQQARVTAG